MTNKQTTPRSSVEPIGDTGAGGSRPSSVATGATTGLPAGTFHADKLVAGYTAAAFWAALTLAAGALISAVLINAKAARQQPGRG